MLDCEIEQSDVFSSYKWHFVFIPNLFFQPVFVLFFLKMSFLLSISSNNKHFRMGLKAAYNFISLNYVQRLLPEYKSDA